MFEPCHPFSLQEFDRWQSAENNGMETNPLMETPDDTGYRSLGANGRYRSGGGVSQDPERIAGNTWSSTEDDEMLDVSIGNSGNFDYDDGLTDKSQGKSFFTSLKNIKDTFHQNDYIIIIYMALFL